MTADVRVMNGFHFVVANGDGSALREIPQAPAALPAAKTPERIKVPRAVIAVGRRSKTTAPQATVSASAQAAPIGQARTIAASAADAVLVRGPSSEAVQYDKAAISLTFSKPVEAGFGSFYLTPAAPAKDGGGLHGATGIVIAVSDKSQVQFAESMVTITPSMALAPATPYTVSMDQYALHSVGARRQVVENKDLMQFVTSFLEDCSVSPWSSWSPCGTDCTPGQQSRVRVVTRATQGGECSKDLEEDKDCPVPAYCTKEQLAAGSHKVIQMTSPSGPSPRMVPSPVGAQNVRPAIRTPEMGQAGWNPEELNIPPGMEIVSTFTGSGPDLMQLPEPMPGGM
jgi:hypothetical protein